MRQDISIVRSGTPKDEIFPNNRKLFLYNFFQLYQEINKFTLVIGVLYTDQLFESFLKKIRLPANKIFDVFKEQAEEKKISNNLEGSHLSNIEADQRIDNEPPDVCLLVLEELLAKSELGAKKDKDFTKVMEKIQEIQSHVNQAVVMGSRRWNDPQHQRVLLVLLHILEAVKKWKIKELGLESALTPLSEAIKMLEERCANQAWREEQNAQFYVSLRDRLERYQVDFLKIEPEQLRKITNLNEMCKAVKAGVEILLSDSPREKKRQRVRRLEASGRLSPKYVGDKPPAFWDSFVAGLTHVLMAFLEFLKWCPRSAQGPGLFSTLATSPLSSCADLLSRPLP